MDDLRGLLGLAAILALAFAVSSNRSRIPWRTVGVGLALQVGFALLALRWSVGRDVLDFVAEQVEVLIEYTNAGIDFLFGPIVADKEETIFAFQVLPVIIFLGALVGLLFYLRVIQLFVDLVGGAIKWLLGTTKVESVYAATVIYLGQSEAPLLIQRYLNRLTRSELFAVMTAASPRWPAPVGTAQRGVAQRRDVRRHRRIELIEPPAARERRPAGGARALPPSSRLISTVPRPAARSLKTLTEFMARPAARTPP